MVTHEYPIVGFQATHESRSRMTSTVQLTHTCSKGCSWRDVILCTELQFINNKVAVRKISNTGAQMKLLLAIVRYMYNRSVVAASAGSRTRVQQALDASYHQP